MNTYLPYNFLRRSVAALFLLVLLLSSPMMSHAQQEYYDIVADKKPTILTQEGVGIGGGRLLIDALNLAPKSLQDSTSVFTQSTSALLRVFGSTLVDTLVVYHPSRFMEKMFVGFSNSSNVPNSSAALQVDGAVTIKQFADASRDGFAPACASEDGVVHVCGTDIDNGEYIWEIQDCELVCVDDSGTSVDIEACPLVQPEMPTSCTEESVGEAVVEYRFDDDAYSAGGQVTDSSGNDNHGTVPESVGVIGGKIGTSATFSGSEYFQWEGDNPHSLGKDNYGVLMPANTRQTNTFSFGGWFRSSKDQEIDNAYDPDANLSPGKKDSGGNFLSPEEESKHWQYYKTKWAGRYGQKYVASPDGTSDQAGAGLSYGANGIGVYEHLGDNNVPAMIVHESNMGTDWNHVVVVYNNRVSSLYVNGSLVDTGPVSMAQTVLSPTQLGHGYWGFFNGQIDEFKLYDSALSSAQVQQLYDQEKDLVRDSVESGGDIYNWDHSGWICYQAENIYYRFSRCYTQDGYLVDDDFCKDSGDKPYDITGDSCSDNVYTWRGSGWGDCVGDYQYQDVQCYNDNDKVSWTWCSAEDKPKTRQKCTVESVPSWAVGSWGSCEGGAQLRTVYCKSTQGDQLDDSACDISLRPDHSQSCMTSNPDAPRWSTQSSAQCVNDQVQVTVEVVNNDNQMVSFATNTSTYQNANQNTQGMSNNARTITIPSSSQCEAVWYKIPGLGIGPQWGCVDSVPNCGSTGYNPQYDWHLLGNWGNCSGGVQTQTVQCIDRNNSNIQVDISLCSHLPDYSTRSCDSNTGLTYNWHGLGNWGNCSGGVQTQTTQCIVGGDTSMVVDDSFCTASRPSQRSCNSGGGDTSAMCETFRNHTHTIPHLYANNRQNELVGTVVAKSQPEYRAYNGVWKDMQRVSTQMNDSSLSLWAYREPFQGNVNVHLRTREGCPEQRDIRDTYPGSFKGDSVNLPNIAPISNHTNLGLSFEFAGDIKSPNPPYDLYLINIKDHHPGLQYRVNGGQWKGTSLVNDDGDNQRSIAMTRIGYEKVNKDFYLDLTKDGGATIDRYKVIRNSPGGHFSATITMVREQDGRVLVSTFQGDKLAPFSLGGHGHKGWGNFFDLGYLGQGDYYFDLKGQTGYVLDPQILVQVR